MLTLFAGADSITYGISAVLAHLFAAYNSPLELEHVASVEKDEWKRTLNMERTCDKVKMYTDWECKDCRYP